LIMTHAALKYILARLIIVCNPDSHCFTPQQQAFKLIRCTSSLMAPTLRSVSTDRKKV
jgi:hypothetical protein